VDDCKKTIKFLETELGRKNDIINKLSENNTQLTTSCSNFEKKVNNIKRGDGIY